MNITDDHEDVRQFLFETSVTPEEIQKATETVELNLQKVLQAVQQKDTPCKKKAPSPSSSPKHTNNNDEIEIDALSTLHDPRSYQRLLYERAKRENIIVHLGTGTGKTLIALMLLQHYETQQQPMVFLVPSVALAVQQHSVLKAHFDTVQLACAYTLHQVAVQGPASVLVATHGAYLDLLRHYPDMYSLEQVSLLILDECHHCIGNSSYATILRDYYHTASRKPRILGLTASPLIAVKVNHTEEQLTKLLAQLEANMDAKIVAPPPDEDSSFYEQECSEHCISYHKYGMKQLPPIPSEKLHPVRRKEFKQLEQLEQDLGPLPVVWYCQSLVGQLKRNKYQSETTQQFQAAQQYLEQVAASNATDISHKLQCLQVLLEKELSRTITAVGVVFVQRRITACALGQYFKRRNKAMGVAAKQKSNLMGQFADAEDDETLAVLDPPQPQSLIRCCSMIRKTTGSQMFRTSSAASALSQEELELQADMMKQEEDNIRSTLDGLRKGTYNVLVATSVVEEGVDLQACSFVIAFDALTTIKSYIQMKGRARQKNAQFYFFQNDKVKGMNTNEARRLEKRIENAVAQESTKQAVLFAGSLLGVEFRDSILYQELSSEELAVLKNGSYTAELGAVFLNSAKSLLYRFALSQPIDWVTRSSKRSLQAYLPLFDEACNQLSLPAYCGAGNGLRSISLPVSVHHNPKKDKQKMLALIACVRLYKNGLLSQRLLPFSRKELREKILSLIKPSVAQDVPTSPTTIQFPPSTDTTTCFVHILCMEGTRMDETRRALGNVGRSLAIVSFQPLWESGESPVLQHDHLQFGSISCFLKKGPTLQCTKDQIKLLREFFVILFNARWKKRTKEGVFEFPNPNDNNPMITPPYVVGCVDCQQNLDWVYMQKIIDEIKRGPEELKETAQQASSTQPLPYPRLWTPDDDPLNVLLVYGPAHEKDGAKVDAAKDLFICQRCWYLPIMTMHRKNDVSVEPPQHQPDYHCNIPTCPFLKARLLFPKSIFREAPFADAALYFEALLLPQFLFHLERIATARAFIQHCHKHVPYLAQCLEQHTTDTDVATILTAASCVGEETYERWEWLGDAVLQVVLTDTCLRSQYLRPWIRGFHEGDLDVIRSALCCNDRLEQACQALSIDRFTLTSGLSRGRWCPSVLQLSSNSTKKPIRGKVLADVMEALLGLVYLRCGGYEPAVKVADELGLTLPWDPDLSYSNVTQDSSACPPKAILEQIVTQWTGYASFGTPGLLLEAFTHPTCLDVHVASYQRLEWIGDAVLSLAARLWIFERYSDNVSVGRMVIMEEQLVCNATLAFLSCRTGWHHHLRHHDLTLPGRIEAYYASIHREGRGIWSTQPPKALADVTESVLGAIFVDGGCMAGLQAAHELLRPFLETLVGNEDKISHPQQELLERLGDIAKISVKLRDVDTDDEHVNSGFRAVATISLWDIPVLTCTDEHSPAATHRACTLLLSIIEKDESSWMQRIQSIRGKMQGGPGGRMDSKKLKV